MKNEDLLKIADAMGLNPDIALQFYPDNSGKEFVFIRDINGVYNGKFDPENNKAQVFEVLIWLLTKGGFSMLTERKTVYIPNNNSDKIYSLNKDLKKNILATALQVVNDE